MELFLEPKSVAVIGATADQRKGGSFLVANLREKFKEGLFPVNPGYDEVLGLKCFKGVQELPGPVDLAIIFVPSSTVPGILEECGLKGIRRVMIQSAGFAEAGDEGRALQERCVSIAREYEMRLWGPNCMGVVNGHTGMVASFMRVATWKESLRAGGVSLVVQSGMLSAGFLMQILSEGYFGLSKACSIGNRCDVNECDLLEYMAGDSTTEVVALYLESISDVPRFRAAISKLQRPVVLLKGGTSPEGATAARSHTASLAGDVRVSEGFFRQMGIHRARDFVEWMDLTKALSLWRTHKGGRRVAVVTFSGAGGIVASDHLAGQGMTLSSLSRETLEKLKTIFPPWMEPENPVDIWPAIERNGRKKAYRIALEALLEDPRVDGIHLHIYVDSLTLGGSLDFLRPLAKAHKPAAMWVIGDTSCFRGFRERIEPMGVPVYEEIERGIRALSLMVEPSTPFQLSPS